MSALKLEDNRTDLGANTLRGDLEIYRCNRINATGRNDTQLFSDYSDRGGV